MTPTRLARATLCALATLLTSGAAAGAADSAYPLRLSADGRRLVDQAGRPFLVNGDAAWSLIVQLTPAEAAQYLDDRKAKGFSLLLVNLIEHQFAEDPPRNRAGDTPFLTAGDFATPNDAYFDHAEAVIALARERGLAVLLAPAYLGYGGGNEGWYQEMVANGTQKLRQYGRYVATRFLPYENVVWLNGGDYNPPLRPLVDAVAEGIREVDGVHLQTAHCAPESSALDVYADASWLQLNDTYSYDAALYTRTLADYSRPGFKPFFMIESRYENEGDGTRARVRRQAWWSVLTGTSGHIYGNRPMWLFAAGWQQALSSPGAQDMALVPRLLLRHAWWTLVPDTAHTAVTAGLGTYGGADFVTAARAPSGLLLMAYVPPTGTATRTLTVNMASLAAPALARFYNPTSGAYLGVAGGPFANSGSRQFTTPGSNGSGTNDWVLVLKAPPEARW